MKPKKQILYLLLAAVLGIAAISWYVYRSAGRFSRWGPSGGMMSGMSPSVSPDGNYVIYSSPSTGHGDIYRVNIDGSGTIRLTDHPDYDGDARCSPDGKLICFIREQRGLGKVWVMNADGSGQRQVTSGDYYDSGPSFSPDGTRLVFARIDRLDRALGSAALTELWTISIEGGEPIRLTNNRVADWEASFSPDGHTILYSVWSDDIYIMNVDGSNQRRLTAGSSPAYSHDGLRIVFIFTEEGWGAHSLWLANSDGSERARIFRSDVYKSAPSFLPDGSRIIYLEHPSVHEKKAGRICTIKTDGSDRRVIAEVELPVRE